VRFTALKQARQTRFETFQSHRGCRLELTRDIQRRDHRRQGNKREQLRGNGEDRHQACHLYFRAALLN
jgi:hypothetical protein